MQILSFNKKRGQSAFEAVMITGVMLLIFSVFFIVISNKSIDSKKQQDLALLDDTAKIIVGELDLAVAAEDGYQRTFEIPLSLGQIYFNITLLSDSLQSAHSEVILQSINTTYDLIAIGTVSGIVNGTLQKGDNIVQKKQNIVCVNKVTCP